MKVLMLSPEPPYPLNGGGAFRTASLLHYFARLGEVDLILISHGDQPALLPPGLVRSQQVIRLPYHDPGLVARYIRNASRAVRGVPPLIDRLAGLSPQIERAIGHRHYDFGIVEHFWCASYVDQMERHCRETVLDLHNIESVLHKRCSTLENGLVRAGHLRFASVARRLESELLPRYSTVLAASEEDARQARAIAPGARISVYPNALPWVDAPHCQEHPRLVFAGNFQYHPNIDAVRFLVGDIWPEVRRLQPKIRLRLVGRGDQFIHHLLPPGPVDQTGIEVTGPVADARSEIAQAQVVVAPLRAGSGTRVKILEAWAAARCVVATPMAAEGLDATDGINVAIESDPKRFAARVAGLLVDSETRRRLGLAGRCTFEDKYCWKTAWNALDLDLQLTPGLTGYTGNF